MDPTQQETPVQTQMSFIRPSGKNQYLFVPNLLLNLSYYAVHPISSSIIKNEESSIRAIILEEIVLNRTIPMMH
jgi:hypothetical protein